jgi:hypothetical protein
MNTLDDIFKGYEDILEDVLAGDYNTRSSSYILNPSRTTETVSKMSDFTDQSPILPLMTNSKSRYDSIRPTLMSAISRLSNSILGDEAASILKKFRVDECSMSRKKKKKVESDSAPLGVNPTSESDSLLSERARYI